MSVFFSKGLFERETKVSSSSSSLYSGRRRDLEEEEDKMVSSRIATQTTTTTTNGIVVATKKTKKVRRFISVCFLSSFAQRFCRLVDFLYDGREFSGRDGMLRRQRRSNPSSSLSRLARLSDFFFCACRCGAGAAMRSSSSFTSR